MSVVATQMNFMEAAQDIVNKMSYDITNIDKHAKAIIEGREFIDVEYIDYAEEFRARYDISLVVNSDTNEIIKTKNRKLVICRDSLFYEIIYHEAVHFIHEAIRHKDFMVNPHGEKFKKCMKKHKEN